MFKETEKALKNVGTVFLVLGAASFGITIVCLIARLPRARDYSVFLLLIPEIACMLSSYIWYGFSMIVENTRLTKEYTYRLLEIEKDKQ